MKLYTLEIEQRSSPWRIVRIEAAGDLTLEELARWLEFQFELDAGHACSFFRSGEPWDKRSEFSSHGRSELGLRDGLLERLALRPGVRFLHVHDYGSPRWHELRVTAVREYEGVGRLRILERIMPASAEEGSLACRVSAVVVNSCADLPMGARAVALEGALSVAKELLGSSRAELDSLGQQLGLDLAGWLIQLPFELAHAGLVDPALDLAARCAEVLEVPQSLGDRAVILAEAGRADDARAQVTEMLARFPYEEWLALKGGDALQALGDVARAEELFRQGLAQAESDYDREGALERLIPLLEQQGRTAEVATLRSEWGPDDADDAEGEEQEEEFAESADDDPELFEPELEDAPEAELQPVARVGRNDPCPCGSGKKFKKCCARSAEAPVESEQKILSAAFERALEYLLRSEHGRSARQEIGRFAGPAFAHLDLQEALPLLPREEAELAYLHWWLIDREETSGATLLELYLVKRRSKLVPREARVLERLREAALALYHVERLDVRDPKLELEVVDLVTGNRFPISLGEAALAPEYSLGRFVELDGKLSLLASVPVEKRHVEAVLQGIRLAGVAVQERAQRAPLFFQAWLDARLALPSTR